MKAKRRTAAQVREDSLVFDKPVMLQRQITDSGLWEDVQHLHANVNKAISTQGFSAENERLRTRLTFRLRYYPGLEDVRNDPQSYRIVYCGQHYEITDYDDYEERRRVIRLTGERYELPVTVTLLIPTVQTVLGVRKKVFPGTGTELECTWEALSGEERTVNGVVSVVERAKITLRRIPELTAECRIRRTDGAVFEIVGAPENTGLSDRWAVLTLRRIAGGA